MAYDPGRLFGNGEIEMIHSYYEQLALLDFGRIQAHVHATDDGVDDYKRWLALRAASPDCWHLLSPSDNMDALWHAHILDTRAYKQCNDLLFGEGQEFMHHDPYSGKDVATRTKRRDLTKRVWNLVYEGVGPKEGWGPEPSEDGGAARASKRKRRRVSDDAYELFIKTLLGRTRTVKVDDKTSILDLKCMLYDMGEAPPDQLRLIFAGKQLEDDKDVGHYKIQPQSTLHMLLRLAGC